MKPEIFIAMLDGLISMIERLVPTIGAMVRDKQIDITEQRRLQNRINALGTPTAFEGPEWKVG